MLLRAEEPELALLPKPRAPLPRSYSSAAHYLGANAEYLKLEARSLPPPPNPDPDPDPDPGLTRA